MIVSSCARRASGLPFAGVLLGALTLGCDDPLKPVERVDEPRVLGARVEVEDEPERAAPYPGERARARFLVAAPELEPNLGYALVACRAAPSNVGLPPCAEPAFGSVSVEEPRPGAPELAFELPEPAEAVAAPRLLIQGVICVNGSPRPSELPRSCASGERTLPVALELELATETQANRNPSLDQAELTFDGQPFEAPAALEPSCRGLGLLELPAGSAHRLRLELPEHAREPVPQTNAADPGVEGLLVSHFVSAGELERAFTPIATDATELTAELDWTAPTAPPADGTLVRFWFVVRDLRGGADYVERAVCVVP